MKKIITVVVFAAAFALAGCSPAAPGDAPALAPATSAAPAPTTSAAPAPATSAADAVVSKAADAPAPAPAKTEDKIADVPSEYKSALKSGETYAKMMNMSKAGVFDQLTSEYGGKFTPEAAQYAIDNIEADWNANALASAKTYQESMAMSPEAIRDQLTSEYGGKFTAEEADYAVANLG